MKKTKPSQRCSKCRLKKKDEKSWKDERVLEMIALIKENYHLINNHATNKKILFKEIAIKLSSTVSKKLSLIFRFVVLVM